MLPSSRLVVLNLVVVWVLGWLVISATAATPTVSLSGPSIGSYATFEGTSPNFNSLPAAQAAITLIDGSSGATLLQPAGGAFIPSGILSVELESGSNTLYVQLTTNQYTAAMFYIWAPSYVPPSSCDSSSLPRHVTCYEIPYADSCSASANYLSNTPYTSATSGFPCASFTRTYIFSNLVVGWNELEVVMYNLNDNINTDPILVTSYIVRCLVPSAGTLPTVAPPSTTPLPAYASPNVTVAASLNLAQSYSLPLSFSFSHCYLQQFTCSLSLLTTSSALLPLVTALFSPPTCSASSLPTLSVSLNLGAAYYDTFINAAAISSLSQTSNSNWDAFLFGTNASALTSAGATIVIGCTFQNAVPSTINATTNIVVQSSALSSNFVSLSVSLTTKTSSTVKFGMSSSAFPSLKRSSRWVSSSVVMSTASLSSLIAELLPWIGMINMNIAAESVTDNSNGSQTITLAFFGNKASVMKSFFILESQLASNSYSTFTYSSQLNPNVVPTFSFDNHCISTSCGTVLASVPSPSANSATPGNYPSSPSSSSATSSSSSSSMSASTIAAIVGPLLLVAVLLIVLVFWLVRYLKRNHSHNASAVAAGSSSVVALQQLRMGGSIQPQQRTTIPYGVVQEDGEPASTINQRREGDSTVIAVLPAYTSSSSTFVPSTAFTTGGEDSRLEGQPNEPPPPYALDTAAIASSSSSSTVVATVTPVGGAPALMEKSVVARPSIVSVSRSQALSQAPLMGGVGGTRNYDDDGDEYSISRSARND